MAKRPIKQKYEPTAAEKSRSAEISTMVYACVSAAQVHDVKATLLDELKENRYLRGCWCQAVRTVLNDIYILEEEVLCDIDTK